MKESEVQDLTAAGTDCDPPYRTTDGKVDGAILSSSGSTLKHTTRRRAARASGASELCEDQFLAILSHGSVRRSPPCCSAHNFCGRRAGQPGRVRNRFIEQYHRRGSSRISRYIGIVAGRTLPQAVDLRLSGTRRLGAAKPKKVDRPRRRPG
jgi:hypothetical protein